MFDIWIGEVDSTTLFVIAAVLFVFSCSAFTLFQSKKASGKTFASYISYCGSNYLLCCGVCRTGLGCDRLFYL